MKRELKKLSEKWQLQHQIELCCLVKLTYIPGNDEIYENLELGPFIEVLILIHLILLLR